MMNRDKKSVTQPQESFVEKAKAFARKHAVLETAAAGVAAAMILYVVLTGGK
ncbi:MAG: hypothetical protein KGI73_01825 [Patescibacteria group bacterium]|nr:hypothetical protein [Patescibacteria group bacterium]